MGRFRKALYGSNRTGGSNPLLSATKPLQPRLGHLRFPTGAKLPAFLSRGSVLPLNNSIQRLEEERQTAFRTTLINYTFE